MLETNLRIDEKIQLKIFIIIMEILSARRGIFRSRESKMLSSYFESSAPSCLIILVRAKMLIKRKLFPDVARKRVTKISSTNNARHYREVPFPRESENLSPAPEFFFATLRASPPCICFRYFFSQNARKVFSSTAICISNRRVPRMIVKGNVKFFRGEIGDASAARVLPMLLTHTHTLHARTHAHRRARALARCTLQRRMFRCRSCVANVRESARENACLTREIRRYVGVWPNYI